MKIVVYYEKLIAPKGSGGGAERVAIEEARYLGAKLLTFEADPEVLAYSGPEGVKDLETMGNGAFKEGFVEKANLRSLVLMVARVVFLSVTLRRLRPDIMITSWKGGWLTAFLATRLTRTPYALHYHKTTFWFDRGAESLIKYSLLHRSKFDTVRRTHVEHIARHPPAGPTKVALEVFAALDYMAVKHAATILVNSNSIAREMKALYGVDAIVLPITGIRTVPAKNDVRKQLGIDGKLILSVSRLEPEKRVDVLIHALAILREKSKNAYLVVVGIGTQLHRLQKLARDLGIESAVKFEGFVPEERLNDYYHSCDLFAFAGRSDFVLTVYEALAAGKKVVCSSEMDLAEEVQLSGLVARAPPVPKAFAETMANALSTKTGPPQRVGLQTWDSYLENVHKICQATLGAKHHRAELLQ